MNKNQDSKSAQFMREIMPFSDREYENFTKYGTSVFLKFIFTCLPFCTITPLLSILGYFRPWADIINRVLSENLLFFENRLQAAQRFGDLSALSQAPILIATTTLSLALCVLSFRRYFARRDEVFCKLTRKNYIGALLISSFIAFILYFLLFDDFGLPERRYIGRAAILAYPTFGFIASCLVPFIGLYLSALCVFFYKFSLELRQG